MAGCGGGGRDLREGRIRVLHSLSFVDDPTRMLRAIRLEQRLDFEIEPRTLELLENAVPLLERISGERIRNELRAIFREDRRNEILRRLHDLGLLAQIDRDLTWNSWIEARFDAIASTSIPSDWQLPALPTEDLLLYSLWFIRLSPEIVKRICDRLHFPIHICRIIAEAESLYRKIAEWGVEVLPSQWVQTFEESHTDTLVVVWYALEMHAAFQEAIERFFLEWRAIKPRISGEKLRAMGLNPGPIYSKILWELRAAWLDGQVYNDEQEQRMLFRLIERESAS